MALYCLASLLSSFSFLFLSCRRYWTTGRLIGKMEKISGYYMFMVPITVRVMLSCSGASASIDICFFDDLRQISIRFFYPHFCLSSKNDKYLVKTRCLTCQIFTLESKTHSPSHAISVRYSSCEQPCLMQTLPGNEGEKSVQYKPSRTFFQLSNTYQTDW